jgi:hypothetical protein
MKLFVFLLVAICGKWCALCNSRVFLQLLLQKFILLSFSDRSSSQTIGATVGASIGDILVPQKDTLSNRVISFIASHIFNSNIAPQLNDVRFYLWTRFESNAECFFVCFINLIYFFLKYRSNPNFGLQLLTNRPDVLNLSTFDRLRPVKVLIHGFGGNGTTDRFVSKARACNFSSRLVNCARRWCN